MQWINGVATRLDTYKKDESDETTKARFLAVIVLLRFMEKNELHFCNDQYAVNLLKLLKLHPKCDTKQCLELDYLQEHKDELLR